VGRPALATGPARGGSLTGRGAPAGLSRRITLAAVLLTAGTGATDVASFTRLGGVFTSVITGNLVLLGLAVARASAGLAEHAAVSVGAYVLGVAIGARVIALAPRPGRGAAADEDWPPAVTAALGIEFALLAVLAAGWELAGTRPAGAGQYLLLADAAAAMGVQGAAVRGLGRGDFSTTYLTGQLTGLIAALVTPGKRDWPGWRQPGPLLALAAGGLISGVLIANAPAAVPVIILMPLCLVLVLYLTARGGGREGNRH
jgi:uncharacterized membrane protein YoaK (UPF0700 family)